MEEDVLWRCTNDQCRATLRESELKRIILPRLETAACPHCGGRVVRESAVTPKGERTDQDSPPTALLSAFAWPLQGGGIFILLAGAGGFAVALWVANHIALGPYGGIVSLLIQGAMYGYLAAYAFEVIAATTRGEDKAPDFPDFSDVAVTFWEPLNRMVCTGVFSFGPALAVYAYPKLLALFEWKASTLPEPWQTLVLAALAALGALYFPMGLLAVALYEDLRELNPLRIMPSIIRVFGQYSVVCGLFATVMGLPLALDLLLPKWLPMLLANFLSLLLLLYGLMGGMRLIGLFYRAHKEKLDWS